MQMSWADTHALLTVLRGLLTVHPLTVEIHETGLGLAERYGLSIYDAMIAASTLHAGCDTLWSEDMQHGMTLPGDRENFLRGPDDRGGDAPGKGNAQNLLAVRDEDLARPEAIEMASDPEMKRPHVQADGDVAAEELLQFVHETQ
jgi:hypothetical protein